MVGPKPDPKALEHAFRLEAFKMLRKEGKIMLDFLPDKELCLEQLTYACNLQYPDLYSNYSNRYKDDYSQLPAEELCLKLSSSR